MFQCLKNLLVPLLDSLQYVNASFCTGEPQTGHTIPDTQVLRRGEECGHTTLDLLTVLFLSAAQDAVILLCHTDTMLVHRKFVVH